MLQSGQSLIDMQDKFKNSFTNGDAVAAGWKSSPICKRVTPLSLSRPTLACRQVVKGAMGLLLKVFTTTSCLCQMRKKFTQKLITRRQPVSPSHKEVAGLFLL